MECVSDGIDSPRGHDTRKAVSTTTDSHGPSEPMRSGTEEPNTSALALSHDVNRVYKTDQYL